MAYQKSPFESSDPEGSLVTAISRFRPSGYSYKDQYGVTHNNFGGTPAGGGFPVGGHSAGSALARPESANPFAPIGPDTIYGPANVLPSTQTASGAGSLVSGEPSISAGQGGGLGGFMSANKGAIGGLLGSVLGGIFGGTDDNATPVLKEAQGASRDLIKSGKQTQQTGADALRPVLHYLAAIQSGNPQAILQATMPERRRVIDQYDSAKQAAQFGPGGGGTAAATTGLNTRQASDLSMIAPQARQGAMQAGAQLGTTLNQQGMYGQSSGAGNLTNLLGPVMNKQIYDEQSNANFWGNLGSFVGNMLPFV